MPTSAPHACAVPGCPGLAPRGRSRCTQHAGSTTVRTPGPHDGVYTTERWRRLARSVIRDEPICHWCGTRRSTVADHVLELRDGGQPYDRANLVGACNPCNVAKGQRAAQRRRGARTL